MLVTINTEAGGGTFDQKTRIFNFMASLHAVATAAAGSTPVVNPVPTSGVKNTSANCITVISNTEAGGWTSGIGSNVTAATTYNATFASPHVVDLYNPSSKSTYPYNRLIVATNVAFSGTITTTTWLNTYAGHTSSNPASVLYTADTSYSNGTWSGGFNPNATTYATNAVAANDTTTYLKVDATAQNITVACTSQYLIINTGTDIFYYGLRTQAPYELARTDNPPWVTFGWSTGRTAATNPYGNTIVFNNHYQGWASTVTNNLATVNNPAKFGTSSSAATFNVAGHIISGQLTTGITYSAGGSVGLAPATHPFVTMQSAPAAGGIKTDGYVTDPTTGLSVPPAYPLVFSVGGILGTAQGTLPGILRGPSNLAATITTMLSAGEYTISGSNYIPTLLTNGTYRDVLFVRKA